MCIILPLHNPNDIKMEQQKEIGEIKFKGVGRDFTCP